MARRLITTRTLSWVPARRVIAVMVTLRQALAARKALAVVLTALPLAVSRRTIRPGAPGWLVRTYAETV